MVVSLFSPIASLGFPTLPLAGLLDIIFDVVAPLLPFILMILYVVAQVLGRQSKPSRPPGKAQPAKRRPPRPVAQAPAGAPDPADEVEEFLRRVAQRRAGRQPADVEVLRPPPPPPEEKTRRLVPERPQRPRGAEPEEIQRKPLPSREPRKPDTVPTELASDQTGRKPASQKAHPKQRPPSRRHAKRPDESAVAHAAEEIQEHIHAVFDHQISDLTARMPDLQEASLEISTAQRRRNEASLVAQGLIELLTTPRDLRRAIIFHEIFDRPVDRWRDDT